MPGLTEQADTAVVFDKPTGRIVEVAATGPVDPAAVIGFYGRTLPQLGWRQARAALESALFVREGETLTIVVGAPPDGGTTVPFSDRKITRLKSSPYCATRMPSYA